MNGNSVLFFTYWYPNKSSKSFGIFVKRHAQAAAQNNKVAVLAFNILKSKSLYKKSVSVSTDKARIETHHIYIETKFHKIFYVLLPLHYLILKNYISKNLQAKHRFNVLHSNIIFPCGIVGFWLAKKFNFKHVITEHWTKIDKFFSRSLYKPFGKRAYNKAFAITCVSEQLATTIKKYTNNNIHIIPNVIDGKEFFYDTSIRKNEVFTFIAAAHWAQHKNPFYFLEALKELKQETKLQNFKVALAGRGVYLEKVKQNHYAFPIEFLGELSIEQLRTELNKSHVFVHGSDFETFSVIIAEALMCGLPCVASPVGIALEVINNTNGFVTNNTTSDWKEKIFISTQTSYNNALIAEQIKNKYDLKTVGKGFDTIYNS